MQGSVTVNPLVLRCLASRGYPSTAWLCSHQDRETVAHLSTWTASIICDSPRGQRTQWISQLLTLLRHLNLRSRLCQWAETPNPSHGFVAGLVCPSVEREVIFGRENISAIPVTQPPLRPIEPA